MATVNHNLIREVLACLMCSHMYFQLRPAERLALVKSLAAELGGAPEAAPSMVCRAG